MRTAAAPKPAPSPAARPALLDPPPPLEIGGALDVCDAAAAVSELDVVDVDVDAVLEPLLVSGPADSLVLVPSVTNGLLWVNGVVVDVMPGQLVLPITVTVDGWLSPSLTAFLPVSQLHVLSPGLCSSLLVKRIHDISG
jgi:hypothetical protein